MLIRYLESKDEVLRPGVANVQAVEEPKTFYVLRTAIFRGDYREQSPTTADHCCLTPAAALPDNV